MTMTRVALRFCELEYTPEGAVTHFPDGASWGALPHPEMPSYHVIAARCGYEDDLVRYAQEHELAHHVLAENFGCHSPVIWALAHDEPPAPMIAAAEEALVLALQRYARTSEHPMIDRVDWRALRASFLDLAAFGTERESAMVQHD
jgi:hypothetical protein